MISYFDNASTTYRKPNCVYKSIKTYKKLGANVLRGIKTQNCKEIIDKTRKNIKLLVGADDGYEVVFSQSATFTINQIVKGIDFKDIKNVYISQFEHNAVTRVLHDLKKKYDFIIHLLNYNEYEFDFDSIKDQFRKNKPDIVIISHISNVCGKIQSYEKVFEFAHLYKAITMLDMAQSCGLIRNNLRKHNVDIAIFAGHKTLYGFAGIGGAIINKSLSLSTYIQGGTGIDSASYEMPSVSPLRFEPGTQNILGIMSLYYSTNYLLKLGEKRVKQIENKKFNKLKQILSLSDYLQPIDVKDNCISIISCKCSKFQPDNYEQLFIKHKICVRIGLQCSPISHQKLNTFPSGTIRFSVGLFTTDREFKNLKKAILCLNKYLKNEKK